MISCNWLELRVHVRVPVVVTDVLCNRALAPVVQKLDSATHIINRSLSSEVLWKPFVLSSGLWFIWWIALSSFWTTGAWLSNLLLKHFTLIGTSTKLTRAYHLWFLAIVHIPNFHGCLFHMLEQTLPKLRWISIKPTAHKELSLKILWVNWRGGFVLLNSKWTSKLAKLTT